MIMLLSIIREYLFIISVQDICQDLSKVSHLMNLKDHIIDLEV